MKKILSKKANKETDPNDFVTTADFKKRFRIWMLLFVTALLFVAGALIVNYLVFIPWQNKQWNTDHPDELKPEKFTWQSDTIFAFILVMVLLVFGVVYSTLYFWFTLKFKYNDPDQSKIKVAGAGFVGGFTDTIGVGSFGVVTGILRGTKTLKDDSKLPGTLNVALGVSALIESSLFVSSIKVNPATLLILLVVLIVGMIFGSTFVSKIKNPQIVKIVMGVTLFVVGFLMILTHPQVNVINTTDIGDKYSLMDKPWRIIVAVILFFFFGAIQAFGIGLYAPAMASLSFLGLSQEAIFPIMACGSAASMIPGGISFIKRRNYLQQTSNIIFISSIFGVVLSFMLVFVGLQMGAGMDKDLFNAILKWMAIAVIFYVAISLIVEYALNEKKRSKPKKSKK